MVRPSSSNLQTSAILISTLASFAIQFPSPTLAFAIQPHPISTPSLLHSDNTLLNNKYGTFNISRGGGGILRSSTYSNDDNNTSEPVELTTRQELIH